MANVPKLDLYLTADGWASMGEAIKKGTVSIAELSKAFAATSRVLTSQSTVTARSERAKTLSIPRSPSTFKVMGVDQAKVDEELWQVKPTIVDDLDDVAQWQREYINEFVSTGIVNDASTAANTSTSTHTADGMRLAMEEFQRRERDHEERMRAKLLAQRQAQLDRIEQEARRRHIPTTVSDEVGSW